MTIKYAMPIRFFFENTRISLGERRRLKNFIENIFKQEGAVLNSLSIIFCTDDFLLGINNDFLGHNYFTDIVTFNLCDEPGMIEGEIYISADRIRENAKLNKVPVEKELHRVIFHGVLHLCGYKDKSSSQKKLMTSLENRNLKIYFA